MVEAAVNGTPITFLVDTGASAIYLTPGDAARLGWTPPRLTYSERYATASGVVHAAPVTLRSLRIGPLELYDLPASVGQESSSVSLLGMTFLKRFVSYEVRGDRLILSRSEEHTSELQSLMRISYAVFCLKKKYHI